MEINTEIKINATAETVWKVLTDFEAYPHWNPFIKSITGTPKIDKKIKVTFQSMTFTPKVLVFDKNKEFRWLGKLWIKNLFDGEHIFKIKDHQDGSVTLEHNERFSGILVPMFKKKLLSETKINFQKMNRKLKQVVEANN